MTSPAKPASWTPWPLGRRASLMPGVVRVGGGSALAGLGHEVVGVDVDPVLIAAAEQDHPGRGGWWAT